MKKTALTFGLFSLVMVATSFAAPKTASPLLAQNQTIERDRDTDGMGSTGGNRKHDIFMSNQELKMKNSQSNFSDTNQSLGSNKKLD